MSRFQRYKERAAELGMRLLSAISPGPCGQSIPGVPWILAVEMDGDVFDQVERCWAACKGLDFDAGETESVLSELTRLREIESQAKAAGFMYDDGEFVDMAIVRRAAARSLIQAMRFVSEEAYSAAWMGGLEFDLFDVCMNGSGDYGSVEVTTDMVSELLILGRLAGGWPVRDDIEGQTIMPMDQWREQYYKWRARKCGYGEGNK